MTNPILQEIQGLSPEAKGALGMAGHAIAASSPPPTPAPGMLLPHPDSSPQSLPAAQPQLVMGPKRGQEVMSNGQATPIGTTLGDTAERQRLLSGKPGVENIAQNVEGSRLGQAHPFLGKLLGGISEGAGMLGDTLLHAAAPGLERAVPGTEGNYTRNLSRADTALTQDEANAGKEASTENETASAGHTNEVTAEMPKILEQNQEKINETGEKNDQARALKLSQLGQTEVIGADGQKHIVDDPGSQVYQSRKALTDYHAAQTSLDGARTEVAQAGNDPNSPAYKLAQQRLATAQQNASAAAERAQAYMLNAEGGNLGTFGGTPLPGAVLDSEGHPVGSRFSHNILPTGSQRGKGNMADSAAEQLGDIKNILQKHADLFGPGYGQSSEFKKWVGSQDPDAQRFLSARTIAADHLASTFGGRSEAALDALDKAIGQFKDNPKAAEAGIDQLLKANKVFQKAGHYNTVGGNPSATSESGSDVVYDDKGIGHRYKGTGARSDPANYEVVK